MVESEELSNRPVLNIVGERVALGLLHRDLLPSFWRWMKNFSMRRILARVPTPLALEQQTRW